MKKILFIASHRLDRAPGQRFRFEQYFAFLRENGFECELSYLLDEKKDRILYSRGNLLRKFLIGVSSWRKRYADLKRVDEFDAVLIFREALLSRSTFFERGVRRKGIPLVIDFDDAIWIRDVSNVNRSIRWVKDPNKISRIISYADEVTVGNDFLASYARGFNPNVRVLPSTIDETFHKPVESERESVCIGWSGSHTTIAHFDLIVPVLRQIKDFYGSRVSFLTIGGTSEFADELAIKSIAWSASEENEQLNLLDVGLMPLPDDDWARGKCGMKALLYMAAGKPVIATPIGVNSRIVVEGETGFLPDNHDEWYNAMSELIENTEKRRSMGAAGRQKVVKEFSHATWKNEHLNLFKSLCQS